VPRSFGRSGGQFPPNCSVMANPEPLTGSVPSGMTIQIRLMTANLLGEETDPDALSQLLERIQPDIFLAQELGPRAAPVISSFYQFHLLDPSLDYFGRGIGSRHPGQFELLTLPHRGGVCARFDLEGHCLGVAGVHLLNPIAFPWWHAPGRRRQQLDALTQWAAGSESQCPCQVIAGDFNASPMWPAYRRAARQWEDLASSAAMSSGSKPEPTWAWRPGLPRLLRIDHVFGKGVRSTSTRVEPIKGSDHAALVVDLALD
jgi:endonuclease/exonuclease/phosphatase (EEP) superfamily protein YafD